MRDLALCEDRFANRVAPSARARHDSRLRDGRAGQAESTAALHRLRHLEVASAKAGQTQAAKVHIYRPARSVMQAGRANTKYWLLEFEPQSAPFIEPLMGWTGTRDTQQQVQLKFPSKEHAIAFAEGQGWAYSVTEPPERTLKPKRYADNFRYDHLIDSAKPSGTGGSGRWKSDLNKELKQSGRPSVFPGSFTNSSSGNGAAIDPVEEAAIESFPASDPPSWIGTTVGVSNASTKTTAITGEEP